MVQECTRSLIACRKDDFVYPFKYSSILQVNLAIVNAIIETVKFAEGLDFTYELGVGWETAEGASLEWVQLIPVIGL